MGRSRTQTASTPSGKDTTGFLPRECYVLTLKYAPCSYAIVVEMKKETAGHVDIVIAEYSFCSRVGKKVTEMVHV